MVRKEGRVTSNKPRRRHRTNDDSSTCLNGINQSPAQHPINTCLHQKHQTEGTSRPLLSHHVPDVNPCNTNPNACKRPTHIQTFIISSTSNPVQPPRPEPPPITTQLLSQHVGKRIPTRAAAVRKTVPSEPTTQRQPDVVESTPKFHHPRKPPETGRI